VRTLRLQLRTPEQLLVDRDVSAIKAEDRSGWVGILPGREDVIVVLPPGLLVFRDGEGETYVALAGGLLDLRGGVCRVLAREAMLDRNLDSIADHVESLLKKRRAANARQRSVLDDLVREVMRRLALEVRT
jgi:F-type H+-transporting ATPase subunit epsilon